MLRLIAIAGPFFLSTAVSAMDLAGTYVLPGGSCSDPRSEGEQLIMTGNGLSFAHLECEFGKSVNVARMDAALYDAECKLEDIPQKTRFFVARSSDGLTIYSQELGTFIVSSCR